MPSVVLDVFSVCSDGTLSLLTSGLGGGVSLDTPKNVSCDSSPLGLGSTSFIKCDRGGKAGGGEEGGPGLAE